MKPIVAQNQKKLGPARCIQLALSGMSYRMFRSLVTMSILALAVAFLVHMLVFGLMSHETQLSAYEELRSSRELGQVLTRLAQPDMPSQIVERLAAGDERILEEYRTWSGVDADRFEHAVTAAATVTQLHDYFEELPVSQRVTLLGDLRVPDLLNRLQNADAMRNFRNKVTDLGVPPPLGDLDAFEAFVTQERPRMREVVMATREGHRQAIEQVRSAYDGTSPRELAARPPATFTQTLADAGFSFDDARLPDLVEYAQRTQDTVAMQRLIGDRELRRAAAQELDVMPADVSFDLVVGHATSGHGAQWLGGVVQEIGGPESLTAERIESLAETYERERELEAAGGTDEPVVVGGLFGLPLRTQVLIGLSFLVCVVGVANAMLMSVTERFTEIATMKCLGAMDMFVMMMFVFEAAIQGVVGGVIGLVLGLILAALRGGVEYGGLIVAATSAAGDIALALLLSMAVGVLLATVAAVGPSFVAARLAPMEAMRVE